MGKIADAAQGLGSLLLLPFVVALAVVAVAGVTVLSAGAAVVDLWRFYRDGRSSA